MRIFELLACLFLVSCGSLSRAERVQFGLDAMRAGCDVYRDDLSIPREPEVDEVCAVLVKD